MATEEQLEELGKAVRDLDALIGAAEGTRPPIIPLGGLLVRQTCQVVIGPDVADALQQFLKRIRNAITPFVPNP